jgi:uncharacterized OsmC-like protein
MTSKVVYQGSLRTVSTHLASGETIISDAPIDNNGKGQAFSPTDTVANALASCMMTVMGIKAESMNLDLTGSEANVTKVMATEPRRISEIIIHFSMRGVSDEKPILILEKTAMTCPVIQSLHPEMLKTIVFNWNLIAK